VRGVVLSQVRVGFGVAEIVDRDDLDFVRALGFVQRTQNVCDPMRTVTVGWRPLMAMKATPGSIQAGGKARILAARDDRRYCGRRVTVPERQPEQGDFPLPANRAAVGTC
jgi:hypothetical protein